MYGGAYFDELNIFCLLANLHSKFVGSLAYLFFLLCSCLIHVVVSESVVLTSRKLDANLEHFICYCTPTACSTAHWVTIWSCEPLTTQYLFKYAGLDVDK